MVRCLLARRGWPASVLIAVLATLAGCGAGARAAGGAGARAARGAGQFGAGVVPPNPFMARDGAGAIHDDSYSSDTTPWPGPGAGAVQARLVGMGAVCSAVVLDRASNVVAYCEDIATKQASLRLLAPDTLTRLAVLPLPRPSPHGGFYLYVDERDRVVLGDGANHVLRIAHQRGPDGRWRFRVSDDWDVSRQVAGRDGAARPDLVQSVAPDWSGRVWFSTLEGVVGTIDPATGRVRTTALPAGEQVIKSLSIAPVGAALASDHALYLLRARTDGTPVVVSRQGYDRGSGIKPGQLAQGEGTTPVFFGPGGDGYLAIVDNADSGEHLLIYRVEAATGATRLICHAPLFAPGASAVYDAPVGTGDSVVVTNTFGYSYNPFAATGAIPGGLVRVDVSADGTGCATVWTSPVRSAALPKMSTRDGYVYTVERTGTGVTASYALVAVNAATGAVASIRPLGTGPGWETIQTAGVISPAGTFYQPTITGMIRVRAASADAGLPPASGYPMPRHRPVAPEGTPARRPRADRPGP
jgi:hypothetical protein